MSWTDVPWGKVVGRSALLLGVAGLALTGVFLAVLNVDPADPYSELAAAARHPAAYRLAAFLDMAVWIGIGAVLLAFGGYFAARAPVRALVLAALGASQAVGALGGALRLGALTDLAARYAGAAPDQQMVLGQSFLTIGQVISSHYGLGQWLYGMGYLVIASLAFAHSGTPRWIALWFGVAGIYSVANQVSVVAVGALLPGLLFLVFSLVQDLVALVLAVTWWRGAPVQSARVAPAPAV